MASEEFGARLRKAMDAAAVPSGVLAKSVGVRPETVSRWLSGERHPGRERLKDIAALLGTPVGYLMGVEEVGARRQAWHRRFALLIQQGVDADTALEIVRRGEEGAGGAPLISAEEESVLRRLTGAIAADLQERSGGRWEELSAAQQDQILAEVERLAAEPTPE